MPQISVSYYLRYMLAYLIGVKTINVGIKPWFLNFCCFFHENYQFFDVFELTRTKSLLF
jgi:hypothetical protein